MKATDYIGITVKFSTAMDTEIESCLDCNIKAIIKNVEFKGGCWVFSFDLASFDQYNDQYATANYYDAL